MMQRRLTTILAADIAAFSRLVSANEERALAFQKMLREEVIDPLLSSHSGRVVNTAGDSFLFEFPSAVEGVRFAVAMQEKVAIRNAHQPTDERMQYRIGLNVGDVVENWDDLLGDGVNIAARLEALAPVGGIIVSRSVRDQVKHIAELHLVDLGEVNVKNIADPQHAFQVLREGETATRLAKPKVKVPSLPIMLFVFAGIVSGVYFWWTQSDFAPTDPSEMAYALPEKPSIVVLPFKALGVTEGADWISDGLTENIISVLSQSPETFVIGRTSSFSYKGRDVTAAQVARDLGVRYVVSGAVQADSDQLRVTAELSDALDGRVLWTLRENGSRDDFFTIQDTITDRIFEESAVSLTHGEDVRRMLDRSQNLELMRLSLQARTLFQSFDPDAHRKGAALAKRLMEQFPDQQEGYTFVALFEWARPLVGRSNDRAVELQLASEYARKSVAMREGSEVYVTIAIIELARGNCNEAIHAADRALELAPSGNDALGAGGRVKSRCGQWEQGIRQMLEAMRVEPNYPGYIPTSIALSYLALGRYDEAKEIATTALTKGIDVRIAAVGAQFYIIAADALSGDMKSAQQRAATLPKNDPLATLRFLSFQLSSVKDRKFVEKLIEALRAANVPET